MISRRDTAEHDELRDRQEQEGEPMSTREPPQKRAWEDYYETYPDQIVTDIMRRWKRNREFFDETGGLAVARDREFDLRAATERARERLNEVDDQWVNARYPQRGRLHRRWDKRRMEFFKAVYAENAEYEQLLRYRGFDPEDDAAIESLRRDINSAGEEIDALRGEGSSEDDATKLLDQQEDER
jgi:hypothetical protein